MAEILGYLLRKDMMGWKLSPYVDFDGVIFTAEDGEKIGKYQGWIAEATNVLAIIQHREMRLPEELMLPAFNADQLMKALKKIGYCLDNKWRIRRFMRPPFTKLKEEHIMPMVSIHLQVCEKEKKNPEAHTSLLAWMEDQVGIMPPTNPPGAGLLPEHEGGSICIVKDRMGFRRIVLKFGDWYVTPRDQNEQVNICSVSFTQYMKDVEPTGAKTVEELLGKDMFLSPEGVIVGRGAYFNISIDDILGPQEEGK
jgi:hypothetical protein